ncbi:MAG: helix-turn-helix transcriptional regulator [Oscillospiraceae bacterium]|nr:helix-turn-helix transcriptional regulator [Oscillospiraceae bacterium]
MNERIKQIREEAKLTQAAFGEKIGISQNYVWMIETGQRTPGDRTIRDICREFGVNETWLRTGDGDPAVSKTREQELAGLFRSLMADRPESFRSMLVSTLLRFDPDGPEWDALEKLYDSIVKEAEQYRDQEK